MKVVDMINGYWKNFDIRICKKLRIYVNFIRIKILVNIVVVLWFVVWWVVFFVCWFVFCIVIIVKIKNIMLNEMVIVIGKMNENKFVVGMFI